MEEGKGSGTERDEQHDGKENEPAKNGKDYSKFQNDGARKSAPGDVTCTTRRKRSPIMAAMPAAPIVPKVSRTKPPAYATNWKGPASALRMPSGRLL